MGGQSTKEQVTFNNNNEFNINDIQKIKEEILDIMRNNDQITFLLFGLFGGVGVVILVWRLLDRRMKQIASKNRPPADV